MQYMSLHTKIYLPMGLGRDNSCKNFFPSFEMHFCIFCIYTVNI